MPVGVVRGIDISNYDGDLTADLVRTWRSAGIGHVVVRASLESAEHRRLTRQQLTSLRDGGMSASVYLWCYLNDGAPETAVAQTLALVQEFAPARYWLDVEDDKHSGDAVTNCAWVRRALAALDAAGVPCGLYSGAWFWGPYLANTTEFSDRLLWTAEYDGAADLTVGRSYGGWALPFAAKQYEGSGTGRLLGRAVDLDVFDATAIGDGPMPPDGADETQRAAFLAAIRQYTGLPYVFGGKSPDTGFDCSGLVTFCARQVGIDLGEPDYTSAETLRQELEPIPDTEARPGDLLFFEGTYDTAGASHVGASLGAGTHRMLDTHDSRGVGETDLGAYWQEHWLSVGRLPAGATPEPTPPAPAPTPDYDALKAQYDDLNNYWSSFGHDTLPPTIAQLRALAAASARTNPQGTLQADLNAIADRLAAFVIA